MIHITKRKGLLLFLLCVCLTTTIAQNTKLKLDTRYSTSMKDYVKGMSKSGTLIAYQQVGFLNSAFYSNKANGLISGGGTLDFTYFYRAWLFRFDLGAFYGTFDVGDAAFNSAYKSSKANYAGVDVYVNFLPMPYLGNISNIVVPSIGVGFQSASISAGESESSNTGSLGVTGLMFKAALQINLGNSFYLQGEYRQGIITDIAEVNYMPYAYGFGIGARF